MIANDQDEKECSDKELWMSPGQFVKILERQELAENDQLEQQQGNNKARAKLAFGDGNNGDSTNHTGAF